MKKYLILLIGVFLMACSDKKVKEPSNIETQNKSDLKQENSKYTLIRDDLYSDSDGNLYLKAINNEDFNEKGNLYSKDVWLTNVFCDSMVQTDTGLDYTDLKLKDLVDKETWKHDSTSKDGHFIYYADKKNKYYHHTMADGGNITLIKE